MEHRHDGQMLGFIHIGMFLIVGSIIAIVLCTIYNINVNKIITSGVETSAELVRFVEVDDEQETKYVAEFKYVVNDVEYYVQSRCESIEKIYKGNGLGYIEQVKYNPEEPDICMIVGEEPAYATVFILASVGVLLIGILLIVINIKMIKRRFKSY